MINNIMDKLSEKRELTPDMMKALYYWKEHGLPTYDELSDRQYQYACHSVHLKPVACKERLEAILEHSDAFTRAQAQRVALVEELRYRMEFERGELVAILIEPKALFKMAEYGEALYHKRQQWRSEYPGTEAWLEQIKDELKETAQCH